MTTAKNEHTGDSLISRTLSEEGQKQFDIIFGVKKKAGTKLRYFGEIERKITTVFD